MGSGAQPGGPGVGSTGSVGLGGGTQDSLPSIPLSPSGRFQSPISLLFQAVLPLGPPGEAAQSSGVKHRLWSQAAGFWFRLLPTSVAWNM